jgi:phospholipid/cholesterol/gamma-HCH transport system substrate-binding protein
MGKQVSPTMVGAFVLGAIALAVLTIVLLGSGRMFTGKRPYILYFDRDVNGLRVGAPVKFRGVDIGAVTAIQLSLSGLERPSNIPPNVKIPVVIEIDSRKIESHKAEDDLSDPAVMERAIHLGLRGQLQMQSFVTGLLYVDLDMHPDTPIHVVMGPQAPYEEIPTLPTALEEAQATAAKVIQELDKADLPGLIHSFTQTAKTINAFVQSPELKSSVAALGDAAKTMDQTTRNFQTLVRRLDSQVMPLGQSIKQSADSATLALKQVNATLLRVQRTVEPESPLNYQLRETLEEVTSAASAMHELADYLERNPSAVVRGRYVSGDHR